MSGVTDVGPLPWEWRASIKLWNSLLARDDLRPIFNKVPDQAYELLHHRMVESITNNRNTATAAWEILTMLLVEVPAFNKVYHSYLPHDRITLASDWGSLILYNCPSHRESVKRAPPLGPIPTVAEARSPAEQRANAYAGVLASKLEGGVSVEDQTWLIRRAWLDGATWQLDYVTPVVVREPRSQLVYDLERIVDQWDDLGVNRMDAIAVIGSVLNLIDGKPLSDHDVEKRVGYYLIPKDQPLTEDNALSGLTDLWDDINS